VKENAKFDSYYNELGIIPDEEKEAFWNSMKTTLPNSFRFTGSKGHALVVQKRLIEHYIPEIMNVKYEGQNVEPPKPIEWFPDQLAWAMTTPKNVIRKFPPFASFQKFLVSENDVGNITRQEIVSMIPPLVMDIKPGMTVLDLCAAPGSKSAQLIEMVHGGEEARLRRVHERLAKEEGKQLPATGMEVDVEQSQVDQEHDYEDDGRATGLLIANDVDYKRAQMLIHQCKRLNSPNLLVTNHDATMFPSIKIPTPAGVPNKYLKFDRILADVPCSGDGTCRKNPEIWREWEPSKGLGLHTTQVRILVRSLQMLKVGGRVVYSTCSMNPIENEAVVAAAIARCGGTDKVKLTDQSHALPGLKRRPGLTSWRVVDRTGKWWDSWKQFEETEGKDDDSVRRIVDTMFPPTTVEGEEVVPLQNCMRVYPHLQDTGGFFICVLEKQSEIRAKPEKPEKETSKKSTTAAADSASTTPSIMNIVNEIEDKNAKGSSETLEHIKAIDAVNPPSSTIMDQSNAPAAARQNMENSPTSEVSSLKRAAADEADALASTKRAKTREEPAEAVELGAEDRQVHFPPPPGAQLDITAHSSNDAAATTTSKPVNNNPNAKQNRTFPFEEPFKYLSSTHPELTSIASFYHLSPRFPTDRYMVRNATGEPVKAIYYTSALARDILVENEGKGLKFVHCGVKMFVKQDVQSSPDACKWRIQSEGLPIVESWVGEERVVRLTRKKTLHSLLKEMFPKMSGDGAPDLAEIGERVRDMGMGCCVLRAEVTQEEDGFEEGLVMPLWRGIGSLNLMLPKEERKAMMLRMFNDTSELIDHSRGGMARGKPSTAASNTDDQLRISAEKDDDDVEEEDGGVALPGQQESTSTSKPIHAGPAGDFTNPHKDAILAKLESSKDVQMSDDADMSVEVREAQATKAMMQREEQASSSVAELVEGERQNQRDQSATGREGKVVAPGISGEADVFNKTV
jgi:multisite-specific tRNA:(cytosine-C5)-methyltransferase